MKISKRTLAILKNFSTINQSIVIQPGKTLQTISNVKDIFAKVSVEEEFATEVAIYDLNEFLGVVSLFEDPEFEFTTNSVIISEGASKQKYHFADKSIITQPPEKGVTLPSVEISTVLTREQLQSLTKAAALNNATDMTFADNMVKVHNKSVPTSNSFSIEDISSIDTNYSLSISVDRLKMVPDDYEVSICAKGLAYFKGTHGIEYFVALQPDGYYDA